MKSVVLIIFLSCSAYGMEKKDSKSASIADNECGWSRTMDHRTSGNCHWSQITPDQEQAENAQNLSRQQEESKNKTGYLAACMSALRNSKHEKK